MTIVMGLFAVLFAFFAKYTNSRWGLRISFSLIFVFLSLRYNFGNDYGEYLKGFLLIRDYDPEYLFQLLVQFEPGWILINLLFRDLGFFAMTAVLALLSCMIYYRFIVSYVPPKYYWLATFIYIFYPDFMLVHSSAMRQSVATMFFIFSIDYLYKRNSIRYFVCIGLASSFHYTALILAPLYLLVFFNGKIRIRQAALFFSLYASLFIFGESLSPYFRIIISNFSEKYETYQDAGVVNSGFGFLYYASLLILVLCWERYQNREIALIFKIAIISFLLMPLTLVVEMLSRLGMYFAPATIVTYPIILMNLKKNETKIFFVMIIPLLVALQWASGYGKNPKQ